MRSLVKSIFCRTQAPGLRRYSHPATQVINVWTALLNKDHGGTSKSSKAAELSVDSDAQLEQAEAMLKDQLRAFQGRVAGALLPEQIHTRLMSFYRGLSQQERLPFLLLLTQRLGVQDSEINTALEQWQRRMGPQQAAGSSSPELISQLSERLESACQPLYTQLFAPISREHEGIPFLLQLRTDVRHALQHDPSQAAPLRSLDMHLKEHLSALFNPGLLECTPLTWHTTPAAVLEKVMQYEAVHPFSGWNDLKARLGSDRRVHAYFHPCLPGEPLVILHAALMSHVPANMEQVISNHTTHRTQQHGSEHNATTSQPPHHKQNPAPDKRTSGSSPAANTSSNQTNAAHDRQGPTMRHVQAADVYPDHASLVGGGGKAATVAAFYSITSTQPGLAGVDLGHFLISDVAKKIQAELPSVKTLVTLSPIPGFRTWLQARLAAAALDRTSTPPPVPQPNRDKAHEKSPCPASRVHALPSLDFDQYLESKEGQKGLGVLPAQISAPDLITPFEGPALQSAAAALLSNTDLEKLKAVGNDPAACLAMILETHAWVDTEHQDVRDMIERLLLQAAARYLVLERRRSLALDPVAHFHLRNGAQLLRINARSDMSPEGLKRSYGLMVNYHYNLEQAHNNNRGYLIDHEIRTSRMVLDLLQQS